MRFLKLFILFVLSINLCMAQELPEMQETVDPLTAAAMIDTEAVYHAVIPGLKAQADAQYAANYYQALNTHRLNLDKIDTAYSEEVASQNILDLRAQRSQEREFNARLYDQISTINAPKLAPIIARSQIAKLNLQNKSELIAAQNQADYAEEDANRSRCISILNRGGSFSGMTSNECMNYPALIMQAQNYEYESVNSARQQRYQNSMRSFQALGAAASRGLPW